ncbi:Ribose ABC transport system, permease protein RbsC [Yersinia pestis Pestoides A]|nr:Ribose ABC transport system, permease protein RbsC [Yersinia pestis Pestoides A]
MGNLMRAKGLNWTLSPPLFWAVRQSPGGKGAIIGTLVGAMMLGVLNNGLNLMSVSPYIQNVVKGGIILAAIYLSSVRRK